MSDDNQLFKSAHAAMTFAYNHKGNASISFTNRMYKSPPGENDRPRLTNSGMTEEDWTAQAGIIRYKVSTLGMLHEAILIADIAPRSEPCPCRSACCSGFLRSQERADAINWLSDNVRVHALEGHITDHVLRRAAVEVFFGEKLTTTKIADDLGRDRTTVGIVIGKVKKYLRSELGKARKGADDVLSCLVMHEVYA